MEGMTYPEIAVFLEVPESTVTGRLQVARNRLRDDLMPLVEETLQEKRVTPDLKRKVMAALPPLLYAAAPAQASLFATLKGPAMLKTISIIGAGIVGTGFYFGGIVSMLDWKDRDTEPKKMSFELSDAGALEEKLANITSLSIGESSTEKEIVEVQDKPSSQEKISSGMYFIGLVANGDPELGQVRKLVINWRDKK